jgi:hypothetical protein
VNLRWENLGVRHVAHPCVHAVILQYMIFA